MAQLPFYAFSVGLSNAEICQLSAVYYSQGQETFDTYALPKRGISPKASQANRLTVVAGQLLDKSKPVKTLTLKECLTQFLQFNTLKSKVVLVAHNGKVFDSRILLKAILASDLLIEFKTVVIHVGFIDSLPMLKKLLPGRKTYKQEELVKDCLKKLMMHIMDLRMLDTSEVCFSTSNLTLQFFLFTAST